MQGKYACLAVAVAVLSLSHYCQARNILCSAKVSLETTELLPHPGSCALFFICDHGIPVVSKCPAGLHFNRDLEVCDWPSSAGCIEAMKKKKQEEEEQDSTSPEPATTSESP